ncbi:NRPS protein [Claviceps africana]|uniref:D-lysergyl-peptide-synthetase subunit 1 n=1 Tax=Claviceps africana TaxID=83212 RepID=A0A8K0JBJ4_9HYPO|nr:NRPS protein [Claviceps africana]
MSTNAAHTGKPTESVGAKGLEFHVPALAKRLAHILESEILLLGWSLLMRRYGIDGTSDFTWGICSGDASSNCTFDFRSCETSWTPVTPLSEALKDIQSYVQQAVSSDSRLATNGATLYFNDECMPDHQSRCTLSDSNTVQWGNVQLRTIVRDESLWVQPMWREPLGGAYLAKHFAQAFVEVLTTILADLSSPISAVLKLGDVDHSVLWNWNKHLPPATEVCIQDLITNQAQKHPTKQAICSWDGNLSYEEVERFSSLLATHLVDAGVLVGDIVPLCFEKSKWTTVAVLGVVKAGAAFVLMDPSQPIQRRQLMAQQVNARFIITSDANGSSGPVIAPEAQTIIVSDGTIQSMVAEFCHGSTTTLPFVSPDSTLYIIFTSGSTGMPKGVVISHSVYTTSALARSTEIGYTDVSRVLDFTSYAFDVSVDSMLSTLLRGGCLCIPSDEDRMNDISGAMRRLGVNMANMTPSVARILDPDIIPSLYSLGIGGEACSAGDIATWGQQTRVVVGYGPAECTIGCTVNPNAAGKPYVSMGAAKGCAIWLVHPDDHDRLVPVGAVGELLIEGPIVGQGYLGDPEKTESAFIRDPVWLVSGYGDVPGRRGRLYKTGDLVRHDPDGENGFIFVGRKDSQVKLRGQRVELGEIEHHIKKLLPMATDVVAEVIAPAGQKTETMLVAFVADRRQGKPDKDSSCEASIVEMSTELQSALHAVGKELPKTVPIYMVPSTYMAVSRIPMLVSGKIDRKTLRSLGASTSLHSHSLDATAAKAAAKGTRARAPTSGAEKCLQAIWSTLLNLKADQIHAQANFFMLGGDSILAMKLVSAVREAGYVLTVAQVFTSPALQDMARDLKVLETTSPDEVPPFSLLDGSWSREALCREAADHCGLPVGSIEDIYPCAPMQEIHMAFYHRSKEAYVAQRVAEIPNADTADRLRVAWDTVIRDCPILRTRIVEFEKHGFLQVVTDNAPSWQYRNSLSEFLREDKETPMAVNSPLSRFTMVHDVSQEKHYFVWTAHHAVYDAWSTELIVDHVIQAFRSTPVQRLAEFKHFIRFLQDPEREKSKTFWLNQLDGATGRQFPELPSRSYIPEPDAQTERFIAVNRPCRNDITDSTIIRAAWALVASQYTMNDDVVFAETFTGRSLPIPGIDQIEGPILATVPVRVRIDRTSTVHGFLQSLQDQGVTRAAHDHYGIQNIRRLSADAQVACEVSMGMVIQPAPTVANDGQHGYVPAFVGGDAALEALHFNTYPLMLACCLQPGRGFRVLASFDSRLVSERQMQRVLTQLESAVSRLCQGPEQYVKDVSCLSRDDLEEIWSANCAAPRCASDAPKLDVHLKPGDVYPHVEHVPWIVSPSNSDYLMPIGATGELVLEGGEGGEGQEANLAAPEWLTKGTAGVPGRHGSRVYETGDLVKYSDALELLFVGRKDDMVPFQGRTIDLKAVDSELARLLPAHVEACSRLISLDDVAGGASTTVVAFVRETDGPETGSTVQLNLDDGNFRLLSTAVSIASTVSVELVQSVACLRKAMLDALPPHMIPSVCIPLSIDGDSPEKLDATLANSLATLTMTSSHVAQIRQSFSCALSSIGDLAKMSPNEVRLRSLWARFLSVDEKTITLDDNFFRLGGDSILAMRIVSALRSEGYVLTVADMFRNMKLGDMASLVREDPDTSRSGRERKAYRPFSLLGNTDTDRLLTSSVVPRLADSSWVVEDVLPVTDTQERDVKSTVSRPRSAVQYNMLHMDKSIDVARVLESFQYLVSVHPILRTVFVPQGEDAVLQVVLQTLEVPVSEHHCPPDEDLGQFARKLAERDVEADSSFQYGHSFVQLFVLRQEEEQSLMIRISHAQYDGVSLPELLKQLDLRYRLKEEAISPPAAFADYLQHMAASEARNLGYWKTRLSGSRLSHIISPADAATSTTRFFTRAVEVSGRSPDVTLATLVTASWATVLARQLRTSDVTFAGIVSGRNVDMAGIEQVMGPCYQYMPVRIRFEPGWTVTRLLEHVRDVYLEGSARATLGFSRISRECTNWGPDALFYPSFVNSLDQGYFDSMPLGGRPCGVDYTNPDAEPATPPRIVSFAEAGESRVGIEADAERGDFWQARLEDLAATMEFFVKEPSAVVL